MKVFALALLSVAMVSVHAGGDKEMYMLKKWAMHKACESCFGEENTRKYMVKIKKAYAVCSGKPTPELDLPMFQNSHRVAGAIVHGAHHHGDGNYQHSHDHHDDDWMGKAMKKFFMKKMFANFMKDQFDMDDDDDMESMDMELESPMRFFKQNRKHSQNRRRYQRDVSKEMLDLGEKLTEKLEMEEMKMEAKIGNMTCMLQECGIITEDYELSSVEDIISGMNEVIDIKDQWLAEQIESDIRNCHGFATSIPETFFEECNYPTYIGRVKMFKKCKMVSKLKTCMNFDIRKKIEENFLPMEDLIKETGMEEHALYPLIMKMLHGPEMDMH